MKTIDITYIRKPFWFNDHVTVQRGYLEEIDGSFAVEECDHAGYTLEDVDFGVGDDTTTEQVRICNKENCGMWFNELTERWEQ